MEKCSNNSYRNKLRKRISNQNHGGPATPQQTLASGAVTPQPATHPPGGNAILTLSGSDPSPNPNMMTTTDHSSYPNKRGRRGRISNQNHGGPATRQQNPASAAVKPQPATHLPAGNAMNSSDPLPHPNMMTTTNHSENSLLSEPPSTSNSGHGSVQNMDTSDSSVGVIATSKTPTSVGNYIQPIDTPSQQTNQENVMLGYPPQPSSQSQQSLPNSSGSLPPGEGVSSYDREREELNKMEKLIEKNSKLETPPCDCKIDGKPAEFGKYYAHLGAAASLPELRQDLESRIGFSGEAIRIEKIRYTGKEGKSATGCPMAKWVIRRASLNEKILVVVKPRPGHKCETAWIIVILIVWEGVPQEDSNYLYNMLVPKLNKSGRSNKDRVCAINKLKTCACQGLDPSKAGTCFSFGCAWSMFYNGCKYAKSRAINKFKLTDESEEPELENGLLALLSRVTRLLKTMHPIAFSNMTLLESDEINCRLDCEEGRAFSAVTANLDFCAHSHYDRNNMNYGLTCVVSLNRHRDLGKPADEQLHVLPLYTLDDTDEFGSREGQENKTKTGAIEILSKFESEIRARCVPVKSCGRSAKKRADIDSDSKSLSSGWSPSPKGRRKRASSKASDTSHVFDGIRSQLQSSQISSTFVDNQCSEGWNYNSTNVVKVNLIEMDTSPSNPPFAETIQHPVDCERKNLTTPPPSFSPLTTHSRTPSSMSSTHATIFSSPIGLENWSPASNYTDNTRDYNSSSQQTPLLYLVQETSNSDSLQSEDQDFLKPFPPDAEKVQHDLLSDFKQVGKTNVTHRKRNHKVSVDVNTSPVMFPPQFEDKSTTVDPSFFDVPSLETRVWSGLDDIIIPSSSSTPPSYPSPTCQGLANSEPQSPIVPVVPGSPKLDPPGEIVLGELVGSTENRECFKDPQVGGVAVALGHGSVLFECAKHELHATTALRHPDRSNPSRVSLVFYQHKFLNLPNHGIEEWARKTEEKNRLKALDTTPKASSSKKVKKAPQSDDSSKVRKRRFTS